MGENTQNKIYSPGMRAKRGAAGIVGLNWGGHYHADHFIPLSLGGNNGAENIVLACAHCNLRKGGKHPAVFQV